MAHSLHSRLTATSPPIAAAQRPMLLAAHAHTSAAPRQPVRCNPTSCRPRARLVCRAQVHARWLIDTRYGCKQDATALLQEWVATVGRAAGLNAASVRLSSGAIGVPESRLEMEVALPSLAAWEDFLARIPAQQHRAWCQRAASMIVDGSPVWQVHRSIPLAAAPMQQAGGSASASSSGSLPAAALDKQLVFTDQLSMDDVAAWQQLKQQQQQPASPGAPSTPDAAPGADGSSSSGTVQLDWKGEPIKFNPGDKLPFKFL